MVLNSQSRSIAAIGISLAALVNANCYYPNGTDANLGRERDAYLPCNPGDPVSMCCNVGDQCRSDGLCLSTWYDNNVWRDMCTDETWQSPSCVKLCIEGTMANSYANNPRVRADTSVTVTPCGDGSYCCGHQQPAQNCCRNGNGFYIDANGDATRQKPITTESAKSTASGTLAAVSTSQPIKPSIVASITVTASPKRNNVGPIAGGVVAGVVVLALLGAGAFIMWRRKRRASAADPSIYKSNGIGLKYSELSSGHNEGRQKDKTPDARYQGNAELGDGERFEAHAEHVHELDPVGPGVRHELGT